MSLTKITTNVIADNAITQNKISNTVTLGGPKIANVQYADASFTVLDDTAANTSGTARLIINGEGFNSGAIVIVGTTQATSTTRVSATQLRANVTAQVAGSYPIYVQNTDGGTAIRVGGVTFSNTPIWGTAATLTNQAANTAFAVSISATSDSSVTYSNTTALPAGTSLLSNGYFYGTVTIGAETTYTFDVKANDAENQDVSRTFSLTVTVTPEYQLWAWGRQSDYGDLGLNSRINTSSPTQVGSLANWNYILASDNKSLAIKSNGTLWAVGGNGVGQLGLGDTIHRSSPVQVGSSTNWSKIGGRYSSDTLAIKTDGTLWAWGQNFYGTLGLGDRDSKSSPTQVGSSTDWSYVEADNTSFAIKTNGTLWSWGYNGLGNLGQSLPTSTHRSSPTQVGSNTNWSMISVAFSGAKAIKTDGTLWTWGDNSYGTNGTNNNELKSSPTQIGSGTNWSVVSTGDEVGAAIKTDGTLWMWGRNESGQLGLNQQHSYLQNKSSPVQVGSSTNWQLISAGKKFTLGIKTDGTLWGWGKNGTFNPHLGLNETTYKSSPTQIGSSTGWKLISAGSYHALAAKQT